MSDPLRNWVSREVLRAQIGANDYAAALKTANKILATKRGDSHYRPEPAPGTSSHR